MVLYRLVWADAQNVLNWPDYIFLLNLYPRHIFLCISHCYLTILLFINPTLWMVNWSDEVIVSGTLKNPAYLLLLQKGVGLVTVSNCLKPKHHWSHSGTLVYVTTPTCTGKSRKLKQFLQYQHNLALFAHCCPISFEILAARDRRPALAVDIWSPSNGASNAN